MRHLRGLSSIRSIRWEWRKRNKWVVAYSFDWVNDYIAWNGNIGWVVVRSSDGIWSYMACYNGWFDLWTVWVDNRSVATIKRRWTIDEYKTDLNMFRWWWVSWSSGGYLKVNNTWKLFLELQGTPWLRILGTTTLSIWTEYNIIVRINNSLPSWSARLVTDADIFINWVLESKTTLAVWNNTNTTSNMLRWAYQTGQYFHSWKMRSLDIRNTALTDVEIASEGVSATVVNTSWLVNSYTSNDVASNIGRWWYNLNVEWNVSIWSDADGSFFWIKGNRDSLALTWTRAWLTTNATLPSFTQNTDFSISCKFKIKSAAITETSGIFWPRFSFCISNSTTNQIRFTLRWSSTVDYNYAAALDTVYTAHLVYTASDAKFYCYINWVLWNAWWTAWPTTRSIVWNNLVIGDNAIWAWNPASWEKYIYHAAMRNVALTQAEVSSDLALWNSVKTDPRIIAYYIPENLPYNTQYMSNTKALEQSSRAKTWATTVTANTAIAPDWTTTADQVVISWTATQGVEQNNLTITGSAIASKTFIIKAFVKVAAWTAAFRLKMTHRGVADYYSSNQTATTVRQEFTFTQTFTSSTSGTWITWGVINDSTATNPTLEVRNVRVFLINEVIGDESSNIWGYVWRKTQYAIWLRFKPNVDWVNTATSQPLFMMPWSYVYIRNTTNDISFRIDSNKIPAWSASGSYSLWLWFRNWAHAVSVMSFNAGVRTMKLYVAWILRATVNITNNHPTAFWNAAARIARTSSSYYSWYVRDPRIYTFTWSFTDADALAIYNWWEPSSAWITKYLHWKPWETESWLTTVDWSWNLRTWALNNGVARVISAL